VNGIALVTRSAVNGQTVWRYSRLLTGLNPRLLNLPELKPIGLVMEPWEDGFVVGGIFAGAAGKLTGPVAFWSISQQNWLPLSAPCTDGQCVPYQPPFFKDSHVVTSLKADGQGNLFALVITFEPLCCDEAFASLVSSGELIRNLVMWDGTKWTDLTPFQQSSTSTVLINLAIGGSSVIQRNFTAESMGHHRINVGNYWPNGGADSFAENFYVYDTDLSNTVEGDFGISTSDIIHAMTSVPNAGAGTIATPLKMLWSFFF